MTGKTQSSSTETRAGSVPEGFEDSAGVTVKKGTAAAELPGSLAFDMRPDVPKGGDKYTVSCQLVNQGTQPIPVKELIVTFVVERPPFGRPRAPPHGLRGPRPARQALRVLRHVEGRHHLLVLRSDRAHPSRRKLQEQPGLEVS